MRDTVATLVQLDAECEARKIVCGDLRTALVRVANGQQAPANERETYQQQMNARKDRWTGADCPAVLEDSRVQDMEGLLRSETGGEDDDVIIQGAASEAVLKCPFTGGELIEPVRNKPCGHVYSTKGAIDYLCQGLVRIIPKTLDQVDSQITKPCCQAACRKQVSARTLERDYATEASQKRAARRAATQGDSDDDDDYEVLT